MSKKKDDFGTIKLTQEELLGKMLPKKAVPRPPEPPPSSKEVPALKPPSSAQEMPALKPPSTSSKEMPGLKPPSAATPTAMPALKPPAGKPGKPVAERLAADACKLASLSDDAKPLLTADATVQTFVQALQAQKLFLDAVKVLAFALPKREALGWGLHSVKQAYGPNPPKTAGAVFHATQLWLGDPNDTHRRLAYDAAEAADIGTPAGCLGAAVFFSGGSLSPPTAPLVAPAPHLTHQMLAVALQLASVLVEPEKAAEKLGQYAADGLKLAAIAPDPNGAAAPAKPGAA